MEGGQQVQVMLHPLSHPAVTTQGFSSFTPPHPPRADTPPSPLPVLRLQPTEDEPGVSSPSVENTGPGQAVLDAGGRGDREQALQH